MFFGLTGGAGTSTLAANVALLLARQRGETAVVIPHDRSFVQALNAGRPRALWEEPQPSPSLAALTDLARQVDERLGVVGDRK
jgi:MinD-like ATPase involved in chromosome partitioning or flagellar assembly